MLLITTAFIWLPLVGPFLGGYFGARRAKDMVAALLAAIVPSALFGGAIAAVASSTLRVGGGDISPYPLMVLAPITVVSLLSGALAGSQTRGATMAAVILMALGLGWFVPRTGELVSLVRLARSATSTAYEPSKNKTCPENLKQLYSAALLYSDGWDGKLPPATNWMDAIRDNVPQADWLRCPDIPRGHGYAMNDDLGGKRVSEIKDPGKTPLFYESASVEASAHDAASSMPRPGRHQGRNNIVYADGSVAAVEPDAK